MTFGLLVVIIASSFFAGVLTQGLYAEAQESKALKNKRATFIAPFQICPGTSEKSPNQADNTQPTEIDFVGTVCAKFLNDLLRKNLRGS